MKRCKAFLCALSMAVGGIFSYASADTTIPMAEGTNSKPVIVTVGSNISVFSVYIEWDEMKFEYNRSEWDDTNHSYKGGGFSPSSRDIKIDNHSDKNITASANYTAKSGVNVSGGFILKASNINGATNSSAVLESAAAPGRINNFSNAATVTYGLSLSGTPAFDGVVEVGDVSVTLS